MGGDVGGDERGQRSVRALQSAIRFASGCLLYADRRARGSLCASGVMRARDARAIRARTRRGREGRARRALDAPSSPRNPPSTSRSGAGASRSPRPSAPEGGVVRHRRHGFRARPAGSTELGGRDAARLTARRRVRSARLTARLTARGVSSPRPRARDARRRRFGAGGGVVRLFRARRQRPARARGRTIPRMSPPPSTRGAPPRSTRRRRPCGALTRGFVRATPASAAFALARACDVRACGGGW